MTAEVENGVGGQVYKIVLLVAKTAFWVGQPKILFTFARHLMVILLSADLPAQP
jgi:hypothetical protein